MTASVKLPGISRSLSRNLNGILSSSQPLYPNAYRQLGSWKDPITRLFRIQYQLPLLNRWKITTYSLLDQIFKFHNTNENAAFRYILDQGDPEPLSALPIHVSLKPGLRYISSLWHALFEGLLVLQRFLCGFSRTGWYLGYSSIFLQNWVTKYLFCWRDAKKIDSSKHTVL